MIAIGMIIGFILGFLLMGLFAAASKADMMERIDRTSRILTNKELDLSKKKDSTIAKAYMELNGYEMVKGKKK